MRIFVLGGAGKMGCIAVQVLANDERVDEVIIADIDVEQAKRVADYLNNPKIKIKNVNICIVIVIIVSISCTSRLCYIDKKSACTINQ